MFIWYSIPRFFSNVQIAVRLSFRVLVFLFYFKFSAIISLCCLSVVLIDTFSFAHISIIPFSQSILAYSFCFFFRLYVCSLPSVLVDQSVWLRICCQPKRSNCLSLRSIISILELSGMLFHIVCLCCFRRCRRCFFFFFFVFFRCSIVGRFVFL